jgi:hypothetical protein
MNEMPVTENCTHDAHKEMIIIESELRKEKR